ncbi:class I SAM-dependent methyltransferase [Sphingomonas pruni]|uniref:class I SAM-dependent methyltransferase n=1 Tax=Sphingomonas pruni TaxID=40683 RepID=UPI00082C78B8|nr:methyltransferase domain-containing protein [Sphingomonas pruni]
MRDTAETAISWHDSIAPAFRDGYIRSRRFRDRLCTWRRLIDSYARPGDRVIDAGCGAGTLSFEIARIAAHVDGIDGSERMIKLARADAAEHGIANVSFSVALLTALSSRAEQYDLALCSSVLEYLPDLRTEVARLVRTLRPGGRLILSLPNGSSGYRRFEALAWRLTGRPHYYRHVRHVPCSTKVAIMLSELGLSVLETAFYADPPLPSFVNWLAGPPHRRKTMFAIVASRPCSDL